LPTPSKPTPARLRLAWHLRLVADAMRAVARVLPLDGADEEAAIAAVVTGDAP
jgi:hypothetical protein